MQNFKLMLRLSAFCNTTKINNSSFIPKQSSAPVSKSGKVRSQIMQNEILFSLVFRFKNHIFACKWGYTACVWMFAGMMTPLLQINQWQMIVKDYKCVSDHLANLHMFIGINVCGNAFCHQSVVLPSPCIFPL